MRIAMVGPFGLQPNQTMRSRALGAARPLAARGHQVSLFMPPWQTPEAADSRWEEDGVALRYTPLRGGVAGITRALLRETLAWRPDVVHCFKPKAYSGLTAWWLWQFHRRRLRLVVDSDDWEGWGGWNALAPYTRAQKHFFAWQERWGMRHCHALTVASRTLQSLAWSLGIPPGQVVYAPNGPGIVAAPPPGQAQRAAERRALGLEEARPVLLLYSRLFEFDISRLTMVLAQVQTAVPDLAILLVGAGLYAEDAAALRCQLAQAELLDRVVDVGWVAPEKLPALLACADVGLYLMDDNLLNRTKCPVKLIDMVAVGVPVVAEAVGQVTEYVVNGRTGLLRSSGDATGLAQDVVGLLLAPARRAHLGAAARAHAAAHFTWDAIATRLERAYAPG